MVNIFANLLRLGRHLFFSLPGQRYRFFSAADLAEISRAIGASEKNHAGEIRLAIESALSPTDVLLGKDSRQRALELFSSLRVWDTENNSGVLVYLLLADHKIEIIADRGIYRHSGPAVWQQICRQMQDLFVQKKFKEGALLSIGLVSQELEKFHPPGENNQNELSNEPVIV